MKNPQSMTRPWAAWAAAGALVLGSASAIAAPLSDALTRTAGAGLRAVELVVAGGTTDLPWAKNILQALEEDQKPKAHAELAILPGVVALVKAAVRM